MPEAILNISRDEAAREIRSAIELLSKARVISPVYHSHCSGLPLQAEIDEFTYKALFLDIGLWRCAASLFSNFFAERYGQIWS